MTPFFSIITVSYNSVKTIAQTIESVLNQPFADFEYLIIDGGSTDGTVELAKSYQARFGDRLIIVSEKDDGIYDAMNKGLNLAKGEMIGIVNSDDWYDRTTMQRVADQFVALKRSGVYYGLLMNYIGDQEYCATGYHHNFLHENIVSHPTCFISRSVYKQYGCFDLQYKLAADYDLMLRLYKNNVPFFFIPHVLAHFRMGGSTDKYKIKSKKETFKILFKYGYLTKRRYYKSLTSSYVQYFFRKMFVNSIKRTFNV